MANKIIRVTATGLVVALVMSGQVQAVELDRETDLQLDIANDTENCQDEKTNKEQGTENNYINQFKFSAQTDITDTRHTNYIYNNGVKEINTDLELLQELKNSTKDKITRDDVEEIYNTVEIELDLYDNESNPVGTVFITNNSEIILEEYNIYTKISEYNRINNNKLIETIKLKYNL